LDALDRAVDELLAAGEEVVEQLLALGVAYPLQDHLLRGLSADAPEIDRLEAFLDEVPELEVRILLLRLAERDLLGRILDGSVGDDLPAPERLEFTGVAVDRDAHVHVLGEALLGRRSDRHL